MCVLHRCIILQFSCSKGYCKINAVYFLVWLAEILPNGPQFTVHLHKFLSLSVLQYYIRASYCNLIVLKGIANLTLSIFLFDYLKYFQMVHSSQCTHFFNCVYCIRASFDIAKSLFEILPNGPQCTYCFHRAAVIAVLEMLPDDSLRWTLMNHYSWFIIIIIIIAVLEMLPDDSLW